MSDLEKVMRVDVAPQGSNIQAQVKTSTKMAEVERTMTELSFSAGIRIKGSGHPPLKKPARVTNPEIEQLREKVAMISKHDWKHGTFWNMKRRRRLSQICERMYVATMISGVVLSVLTPLWYYYFSSVRNVYQVSFNNQSNTTEITTPFVEDIKYATGAFAHYLMGTLLLFIGGLLAGAAKRKGYKQRTFWYLAAIVVLLVSIAFILMSPLLPLLTNNSAEEVKSLNLHVPQGRRKGSINYFRNSTQCRGSSWNGTDNSTQVKMKLFCNTLFYLVVCLYFMWYSAVIPLISFVFCCVELIVNRKYWNAKAVHRYKMKTPEQIADDRSKSDTILPHGEAPRPTENFY